MKAYTGSSELIAGYPFWVRPLHSLIVVEQLDPSLPRLHLQVIKAFDAVNYFIQENVNRINLHHLALFNTEQVCARAGGSSGCTF